MEERDAPTQILIGAEDWRYCTLSLLGGWLEYHYLLNPAENEFIFGVQGMEEPDCIKAVAAYQLRELLADNGFEEWGEGLMGTHSLRKFAVTVGRRNGCSKDEIDHRGRWKGDHRQQDTYADTTIPYVDAKVAAALCKGGPIFYMQKEGSGITNQWILDYVVPNMAHHLPRQACVVLGRALLWKIFHVSGEQLPIQLCTGVMSAYNNLPERCSLEAGENPVRKTPLGVAGVDAELIIDEIMGDDDNETTNNSVGSGGGQGNNRARHGIQRQEVRLLSSQVMHLRRELSDSRAELERRDAIFKHKLTRLNNNVARLAAIPGRRSIANGSIGTGGLENGANCEAVSTEAGEGGQPTIRLVATLSSRPKTLHTLWKEYTVGMSGKKPARDFSESERGRVKSVYSILSFSSAVFQLLSAFS